MAATAWATDFGEDGIMHGSREVKNLEITVIYDNNPYDDRLETAWGFSCLIRGTEKTILFDTGGDGSRLLKNMGKLGIHPEEIDAIILSHIHGDHVGGLRSVLEKNPDVIVYLPKSFPESFKDGVKGCGARVIDVLGPLKICENVYSTGEMDGGIKEQSLIIKTEKGIIVITGCAHPGIVGIVKEARNLIENRVLLVMGGFHLSGKNTSEIENIIRDFKKLGVRYVGPCHCTGDKARQLFEREYQENYIDAGAGKIITMDDLK